MVTARPEPDIAVCITQSFRGIKFSASRLKKLVRSICRRFIAPNPQKAQYQINIAIVNDSQFRCFNNRFLDRNGTSDCLSFDLSDQWSDVFELIVNGQEAEKQAHLRGHSGEAELALYVTHGLLHNLGFDDSTPGKARKMHKTEDEILQHYLYGPVYHKKQC
jgi:probable rRNA maturation factor